MSSAHYTGRFLEGQVGWICKWAVDLQILISHRFRIDDLVMMGSPNSNLIQAHQRRRRGAEPVDEASRNRAGSGSVIDHICRPSYRYLRDSVVDSNEEVHMDSEAEGDGPDVELGGGGVRGGMGLWIPDLTLRYPPTFSHNDFIVGIDGGILARGVSVADFVDRPKFANVTLIRDQVWFFEIVTFRLRSCPNSQISLDVRPDCQRIRPKHSLLPTPPEQSGSRLNHLFPPPRAKVSAHHSQIHLFRLPASDYGQYDRGATDFHRLQRRGVNIGGRGGRPLPPKEQDTQSADVE